MPLLIADLVPFRNLTKHLAISHPEADAESKAHPVAVTTTYIRRCSLYCSTIVSASSEAIE
jgi:hypothetical protein